jgi:hypothetical protein
MVKLEFGNVFFFAREEIIRKTLEVRKESTTNSKSHNYDCVCDLNLDQNHKSELSTCNSLATHASCLHVWAFTMREMFNF